MSLAIFTVASLSIIVYTTTTLFNRPPGRHRRSADMEVEFIEDAE